MTHPEITGRLHGLDKGRVLADTHVLVWAANEPDKLSPLARALFESPNYEILASAASAAEIWWKARSGRLDIAPRGERGESKTGPDFGPGFRAVTGLLEFVRTLDIGWLPLTPHHVLRMSQLPEVHKDPFDRLLIAQAIEHAIPLLTIDKTIRRYDSARVAEVTGGFRPTVVW